MQGTVTYEQIHARLSCETSLPQIPLAALRLNELVDTELISQDVLRVVASDPGLTAGLLRSASSPLYALSPRPISDVRTALSILGVRGVKSVAMSVLMQSVAGSISRSSLDAQKFVQHSTFVGIMAKYVFLRRCQMQPVAATVNPDQVFAAGILHDLGLGLVAISYPALYGELETEATGWKIPTWLAFQERFGESILSLTLTAFQVWKLPAVLGELISGFDDPSSHPTDPTACAALAYADWLANLSGFSERLEPPIYEASQSVKELVGLPADEIPGAVQQVVLHTESCMVRSKAA